MKYEKPGLEYMNGLKEIFPEEIFDAHVHIYRERDLNLAKPSHALPKDSDITIDYWQKNISKQLGGADVTGGLFCPYPSVDIDFDATNQWLINELAKHPKSRGLLLISPKSDVSEVEELLENPQIVGFKPYHFYADVEGIPSMDDFLPEWAWQLADAKGLLLLVHLVRQRALADEDNAKQIGENCLKYPEAKLMLAHAGRGFHAANTVKGVKMIAGIENVYFDNSAICEAQGLFAILKEFGPEKLMWGSDFPLSEMPSKCVSVGDGFIWIDSLLLEGKNQTTGTPDALGIESIRALKEAGDYFGLDKSDYKKIFCDNIMNLLGIKEK